MYYIRFKTKMAPTPPPIPVPQPVPYPAPVPMPKPDDMKIGDSRSLSPIFCICSICTNRKPGNHPEHQRPYYK